jgi:hypothetical protein
MVFQRHCTSIATSLYFLQTAFRFILSFSKKVLLLQTEQKTKKKSVKTKIFKKNIDVKKRLMLSF